jgi:hypothetical protein
MPRRCCQAAALCWSGSALVVWAAWQFRLYIAHHHYVRLWWGYCAPLVLLALVMPWFCLAFRGFLVGRRSIRSRF